MIHLDDFTTEDKATYQMIVDEVQKTMPRQATVLRVEGADVVVTFGGLDTGETVLPCVTTGIYPGMMGWMYPLAGGKGLFVPMAVSIPRFSPRVQFSTALTISSSGEAWSQAVYTFGNLIPGRSYQIMGWVSVRTTGTGTRRLSGCFRAVGATTVHTGGESVADLATRDNEVINSNSVATVGADENGEIQLTAGVRWVSGTVTTNFFEAHYIIV